MNAHVHTNIDTFEPFSHARRTTTELHRGKNDSLWLTLHADDERGINNFTPTLLSELREVIGALKRDDGRWDTLAGPRNVSYIVVKSSDPEYFSVGGDLSYFRRCIAERDADALREYSTHCLDLLMDWSTLMKDRMTTVSLIQGRALGGGWEMALSCDYIIAEEHSSFGFPEIMFGLFPCTGAMGLLTRRIGAVQAERIMTSGRVYTARELHSMGLVDEVVPTGSGERAVEDYIVRHGNRREAFLKVQQSRIRMAPLDYIEGMRIVDDWVELAMRLSPAELRSMEMLIMMQSSAIRGDAQRKAA
ncbi:MAG: enoyl-CoA hydratase/isomerase family protein [Xanthomonadaceae bacterium]|nr:enoyl-CoA hydratase/isomerase family protein [Xanthomonadaceae bacterium]